MNSRNTARPADASAPPVSASLTGVRPRRAERADEPPVLKSPLRYPGGKSRGVREIYHMLPAGLDRLCAPFAGGASLELVCAQRGIEVKAYDAFAPLVNFWRVLLDDAPRLAHIVRNHYPISKTQFYALQKRYGQIKDTRRLAAAFYVLNRSSFSGTTLSGGMSPGHPRFTESAINRLANFRIKNFSVAQADFSDSIKRHKNDFLYLDPPYATGGKLYGDRGNCHAGFDHTGLARILRKRDGWLLSYNDCAAVRERYDGFDFVRVGWAYGMNNSKASNEVLILSRDCARVPGLGRANRVGQGIGVCGSSGNGGSHRASDTKFPLHCCKGGLPPTFARPAG